jgi:hypothetical protein
MKLNDEKIFEIIKSTYSKYQDNETIIEKINNYIKDLPDTIHNYYQNNNLKLERKNLLLEGQDKFISDIINQKIYFYSPNSELFFSYNKKNYNLLKEDDLIFNILNKLNYRSNSYNNKYFEEQLLPWKFKIKTTLIKKIKEQDIRNSIPDSETIQNVINIFLYNFFDNKNLCKYFLTIIGDLFLKKIDNNIYIINSSSKFLLRIIDNLISKYFTHNSLVNNFKYKYHEHIFENCRLIHYSNNDKINDFENKYYELIKNNIINIYVVACYLSKRYNNSDNFLLSIQDNIIDNILYLKNNNVNNIINNFINSKIEVCQYQNISFKNMLYLWKSYINSINIPNIVFQNNFKNLLINKLNYDESNDYFINYTSNQLPFVGNFIKFWEENIYENIEEIFIEISEITYIYKQWLNNKKITYKFNDNNIIELIKHYYSDIVINEDKYIFNYSIKVINKKETINNFLSYNICNNFYIYENYINYCNENKINIFVSKLYFELYIQDKI